MEQNGIPPNGLRPAVSAVEPKLFSQGDAKLLEQVRERAENLFDSREMLCAEAVIYTLNEAFAGSLTPEEAVRLGSPFCVGIGGAGCTCGALTGAIASAGLFLGRSDAGQSGRPIQNYARELHDDFCAKFGSTCCRVLTRRVKNDKKAHFEQCRKLTGYAAELVARRLLMENNVVDTGFLAKRSRRLKVIMRRLVGLMGIR